MDSEYLPVDGWRKLQLGDIAVISYGYTAKASVEDIGSKFLRITDIQNDRVDWSSVPYCLISEDEFKSVFEKLSETFEKNLNHANIEKSLRSFR